MKNINDIEFVKRCIDNWYNNAPIYALKFESKELLGYDINDGGVPKEMEDGKPDKEGYVKWKLIPSKVNETQLKDLEKKFKIQIPELYKAYLMTYCHLGIVVNDGKAKISLPALPSDYPLKEVEFELDAWRPLISAGYIPFGDYEDGWGQYVLTQ